MANYIYLIVPYSYFLYALLETSLVVSYSFTMLLFIIIT